ncbi:MAG: Asp-tRNA(Asn)/Glu-tRNA(Gln) amidotransferase GatCAB subunit B, partial [Candidatus Desulforudis sp.]|nr:Asp-tRNA(Asn)/Glu-tRNA(Gln) amidotransferase GatCAB subunit B [Bacillota bacterium]MBV1770779.1 Asp-tRNA(Asn)/Glu-tRNA(Gln) amidotransferase GatCAB subunit B [Desulforudis sp.]
TLIDKGTISGKLAKEVFGEMFRTGKDAEMVVKEKGLEQISDEVSINAVIEQVIASHPGPVADYRAGKDRALGFLVGQIMKDTRGKANPGLVNELLKNRLR